MATTFVNIRDKIKAALDTLKAGGGRLQSTYAYFEPLPQSFPSAMVDVYTGHTDTFYTTSENMMIVKFLITVQIRGKNDSTQADLRLNLMDDIRDLFSKTPYVNTLDGLCDIVTVESINAWNDNNTESPKIGFDIVLACSLVRST